MKIYKNRYPVIAMQFNEENFEEVQKWLRSKGHSMGTISLPGRCIEILTDHEPYGKRSIAELTDFIVIDMGGKLSILSEGTFYSLFE